MSNRGYELGFQSYDFVKYIDWFYSQEALVRAGYFLFEKYVPDGNRDYRRGEVIRTENYKWLLQNWGRLDPLIPLIQQPLLKLFRDNKRYEWVREEFCLQGFERSYGDQWYRVITPSVDSATAPPFDTANWQLIE